MTVTAIGLGSRVRVALRRRAPVVEVLVWLARVVGLLTVVVLLPAPLLRRHLSPSVWFGLPPEASLVRPVVLLSAGVGLILLAAGLRRRKRRAWQLSIALCVVIAATHAVGDHPRAPSIVALVLLGGLVFTRHEFTARPDPVGRWAAVRVVIELLAAGFVIVTLILFVRSQLILGHPSISQRLTHAALSLIGVEGPLQFRQVWLDDLTAATGLTFGLGALLLGGYFLLRAAEPHPFLTEEDDAGIRRLLEGHGQADSLGYFALRRDKSAVFSASGKAAVSYRVLTGVALASGDPLGDAEAWPGAIEAFLSRCRDYGWVPAVLGCSESGAKVWAREGSLDALELGDEAVVDVAGFSLQGRSMRTVRQAVSRVRRAGYETTARRVRDVPAGELDQLRGLVEHWRGGPDERGFSMALSRVADTWHDPDAMIIIAKLKGRPRGLLQFVPWGPDGLSLDLMVRDPAVTDNGLNELLITDLLSASRELDVNRVSLNFAVFRSALEQGERIGAGPIARLWARALRIASRWWQIETLYRFNARFSPAWVPRYLVFDAVRDLPRVAVAVLEAEGFGERPPILLRLLRRHSTQGLFDAQRDDLP